MITAKKNEVAPISFGNTLERETKYVSGGRRRKVKKKVYLYAFVSGNQIRTLNMSDRARKTHGLTNTEQKLSSKLIKSKVQNNAHPPVLLFF